MPACICCDKGTDTLDWQNAKNRSNTPTPPCVCVCLCIFTVILVCVCISVHFCIRCICVTLRRAEERELFYYVLYAVDSHTHVTQRCRAVCVCVPAKPFFEHKMAHFLLIINLHHCGNSHDSLGEARHERYELCIALCFLH